MRIGDVLRLIRTRLGNDQKKMAEFLGISSNYLSQIETNKREPTQEKIKEFADHLQISKEALIFLASDIPKELGSKEKKDFQRLQQNILSLILFELNGKLSVNENP